MNISIIIPAYDAEATLAECLEACLAQTHADCEVIVVDDESSDATAEIAQGFEGVSYVHQENAGPAAARNHGVRMAKGDVVVLTDSDCIPEPNWIEELITGFDAEEVVAVGGTYGIANPESPLARIIHAEIQLRHEQFTETVDFLGSFNVAYRREVFLAIGGFDENFRAASGEDNDLAYRLQDSGGIMRFVPTAIVNHYHPTELYPYLKTQMNHGFWRMKLYAKHPKRSGGDQYAGKLDFLSIPFALFACLVAITVCLLGAYYVSDGTFRSMMFANAYAFIFLPMYLFYSFLLKRTLKRELLDRCALEIIVSKLRFGVSLIGVLFSRDLFRGFGLIKGVIYFILLRKETI